MQTTTELTDYMDFMVLLDDEEKLVRETARNFVNAQVLPIIDTYEGTHDMHTLMIGQEVTGIAAYR